MNEPILDRLGKPGANPDAGAVLANASPGGPAQILPVGPGAHDLSIQHAGGRGGRKRLDGLEPGSEAAQEADRRADAARKRLARARASGKPLAAEPAPLPARPAGALAGAPGATAGPLPGEGGGPNNQDWPWTEKELAEITDEMVDGLSEYDKTSSIQKLARSRIPLALITEIEADAEMPEFCKKIFKRALPKVAAKYLNETSLTPENKDAALVVGAGLFYVFHKFRLGKRLDALVKAAGPAAPPPKHKASADEPLTHTNPAPSAKPAP